MYIGNILSFPGFWTFVTYSTMVFEQMILLIVQYMVHLLKYKIFCTSWRRTGCNLFAIRRTSFLPRVMPWCGSSFVFYIVMNNFEGVPVHGTLFWSETDTSERWTDNENIFFCTLYRTSSLLLSSLHVVHLVACLLYDTILVHSDDMTSISDIDVLLLPTMRMMVMYIFATYK